jgi:hypothetical protein
MNVEPASVNFYNSPKLQCVKYGRPDGSEYYARVSIPSKNANTRRNVRGRLFAAIPLLTHETFFGAPDGIYTWLMCDKGFFASPVLSVFEHGTVHANLTDRVGASRVDIAGEAQKTGDQLRFNLLSGTYTRHILEAAGMNATGKGHDEEKYMAAVKIMETRMIDFFKSLGFGDVVMTEGGTLITGLPTESELRMYAAAGYDVDLFKTKDTCVGMKRKLLENRITLLTRQLGQNLFKEPKWQEKLGREKAALEAQIAELNANVPVRLTGGRRRRTRRR